MNQPVVLFAMPIGRVFYEEGTAAFAQSPADLTRISFKTFRQLALLGLPFLLALVAFGPQLFSFVLGDNWSISGEYARWLMPGMYLTFIASPLSYLVDIRRKLKEFLYFNVLVFGLRLMALLIGGQYLDALQTIQLFGAANVLLGIIQIAYLLYIANPKDLTGFENQ